MSGRILIVEDEAMIARFIRRCLEEAGYQVTGAAPAVAAALASAEADRPDLALVDVELEDAQDGVALARELRDRWGIPFVFVTAHDDEATIERLKVTEPLGYVAKPFEGAQLIGTLRVAFHHIERERERAVEAEKLRARTGELERGLRQIGDLVRDAGFAEPALVPPGRETPLPEVPGLSKREVEVLRLLLANRRVPAIARQMGVSPHTVRNHLKAVFRKTGVHSQAELIERFDARRRR